MKAARVTAIALIAAAIGAAPASAFEKGSWMSPAGDLSVLGLSGAPRVTVGPDGTMVAIWSRSDSGDSVIQAAMRAPGGPVSDPLDLSAPGGTVGARAAIGSDGTVTAVWSISRGADTVIEASTRPPGGTFGAAVTVGGANFLASPDIGIAPDGTTTITWATGPVGQPQIAQAATRPPGGAFGAPVPISAAGQSASNPQLVVAADGTATVAWNRSDGSNQIVQATTRPPGGAFGAPVDLSSTGANAEFTDIAVAPDGTTTAVWTRSGLVQAATRPPSGSFGVPVDVSRAGETAQQPRAAVAGDGTTTVVWRGENASFDTNIQAATRPPGGSFPVPVDLMAPIPHGTPPDPPAFVYDPRVAAAADGTTTAMWTAPDGTVNRVQASTRLPGGAFGTPVFLSTPGLNAFTPEVGMAADGYATAVWSLSDGISRTTVQGTFTADAPIGRGSIAISGTPALGSTLGCDGGRWFGATSVEARWLRGAAEVATGTSYVVADADQGSDLTCRAKATNALGSTERSSLPLSIPAPAPPPPPVVDPGPGPVIAPPRDLAAPRVTVVTRERITRRQFLSGVSVTLSTDEPAKIVVELMGRASRSRTTGPFTRRLASRTLHGIRAPIKFKIKPKAAAVGRVRTFPVRLRLTITDALGNKRITGKTLRIAG